MGLGYSEGRPRRIGGATMLTTVEPAAGRRPLDPVFVSGEVFRRPAFGDNHPLAIGAAGQLLSVWWMFSVCFSV